MVINLIKINYCQIRKNLDKLNRDYYLVLKSNAYGFGIVKILKIALVLGFSKFAVINLDEAIKIRKMTNKAIILLMGVFDKRKLKLYEKYQIRITINDIDELKIIRNYKVDAEIKVNVGMNRFGVMPDDLKGIKLTNQIKGIYGHISRDITKESTCLKSKMPKGINYHLGSSKQLGMLNNCMRIGVAIYDEALEVYAKIIKVNFVKKGEYIGYDFTYQMPFDGYIGVLDIGYADGLVRECNGFKVWIKDNYYQLVGNACMNHSFVLLDNDNCLNNFVEIIGRHNHIYQYCRFSNKIKHQIYLEFLKKY